MYQPYGPAPVIIAGGMRPRFYRAAIDLSEEDIPQDVQERIMAAEEFCCPICMEHPINPVIVIPCGHTLCDGCADEHAGHGGLNGLNATCPECRGPMDHMTDYNNFCYMFSPERLDPGELEELNAAIAEEGEHVDGPHPHPPQFEPNAGAGRGAGPLQPPGPFFGEHDHYGYDPFLHPIPPPMYYMRPGPLQDPRVPMPLRAMEVGFPPLYYGMNPNLTHGPHHGFGFPHPHPYIRAHNDMPWHDAPHGYGGGEDPVPEMIDEGAPAPRYPNSVYTGELPIPDIGDYSIRPGAFVRRRRPGGRR